MAAKKTNKPNASSRGLDDELKCLQDSMAEKMPPLTESGNFLDYGKKEGFHQISEADLKGAGFHSAPTPDKLHGYRSIGIGIIGPIGCQFEIKNIKLLNSHEPHRRFSEALVTYETVTSAKREVRTAHYVKEHNENLETLGSLEKFMSSFDETDHVYKDSYDSEGFIRHSQWGEVVQEFAELQEIIEKLSTLDQYGSLGAAIGTAIRWYSDRAYHLGLRVREAELAVQQPDTVRGKTNVSSAKEAAAKRGNDLTEHANKWHAAFNTWICKEMSSGKVDRWLSRQEKKRLTITSIAKYSELHWPGFKGLFELSKPPSDVQLKRRISAFVKIDGVLKDRLRK